MFSRSTFTYLTLPRDLSNPRLIFFLFTAEKRVYYVSAFKGCFQDFICVFADNLVLKGNDTIIIPVMCIMCVAIPFVLITLAPRFISAAEVNLFFLLETILGPLWVWFVIKEQPSTETIIGGVVIIATIATHSILSLKKI